MPHKIIAGNWKMNKNYEEGLSLASEVMNMVQDEISSKVGVVICTPSIHLSSIGKLLGATGKVRLGAQNVHPKASGAFTGELSVGMLQSVGAQYIIVGHSERREYFNETDTFLLEKLHATISGGLRPIFCCGEPLHIREQGSYIDYIKNQISATLFHLDAIQMHQVVIAYEPIWAIGTGLTASPEQAQEVHAAIREHLASHFGNELAIETSILYGGSVKSSNAASLFSQKDVDGALIGGASLESREFVSIAKAMDALVS